MRIYRGSERGMFGPPPLENSKNSNLRSKILKNMPWTSPDKLKYLSTPSSLSREKLWIRECTLFISICSNVSITEPVDLHTGYLLFLQ